LQSLIKKTYNQTQGKDLMSRWQKNISRGIYRLALVSGSLVGIFFFFIVNSSYSFFYSAIFGIGSFFIVIIVFAIINFIIRGFLG